MDNAIYAALTRQSGLAKEMQVVANNIANMSTSGYRREGVVFAEHIRANEPGFTSLSMAHAKARIADNAQGALTQTNGEFDFAIEGPGFFMVETPSGNFITRASSYGLNDAGEIVSPQGFRLLDGGAAPIQIPPGSSRIAVSSDGVLSADGQALAQIGVYFTESPNGLTRQGNVLFDLPDDLAPDETSAVLQGYIEGSNVDPVSEIARMIEVQRAYELGQGLLEQEDKRIRGVIQALSK